MTWVSRRPDGSTPQPNQRTVARRQRFAHAYLANGLNASQAAITAGYRSKWASRVGHDLLGTPEVRAIVEAAQARHAERAQITAEQLVDELVKIVQADPRELVEYRRTSCPDCWLGLVEPEQRVDPECPACGGLGIGQAVFKDTREMSPQAVALLASIETTRGGMRYRLHPKLDAIEKLMRYLGLYEADNRQKNEGLNELAQYIQANAMGLPIRSPGALPKE